jgi:hypothetical protein
VTLLGRLSVVTTPSARAAAAIESEAPVHDALAAILSAAPFHETRSIHIGLMLTSVDDHLAAVLSTATLNRGHINWL